MEGMSRGEWLEIGEMRQMPAAAAAAAVATRACCAKFHTSTPRTHVFRHPPATHTHRSTQLELAQATKVSRKFLTALK